MSFVGISHRNFALALQKLEFDKVIDRVVRLTASEPGRARARQLFPSTDPSIVRAELHLVSEAKELLVAEGSVPLDGIKNIAPALKKTLVENLILSVQELLDIFSTLRSARTLHGFLSKRKAAYPSLATHLQQLFYDKVLEFNIEHAIDESGNVRDTASKALKNIRQDIIEHEETLRKQLSSILRKVSEQEFVQEEIVTTRDGRLVIPIKAEHKKHVPGFVHTSSASGATVYIEPAQCLELNNTLRELHLQEQREIEKILGILTQQVRDVREQLEQMVRTLATIDLVCAKAKYSIEVVGESPTISDGRRVVRLLQARHPVLLQRHKREDVVPLDLELGVDEVVTLIITGPNAGGKSVAMKTVGLIVLCAQAGLHIPAAAESELPVFESVLVDIGDEQSIENDLSTFSSHLVRLNEIVTDARERSLVLIDEIGAGTDPAEGAALGAAILRDLTERHTMTIATTHHGMLKAFAHTTTGMANGSLEFDQATLSPTYRFRFGVPGSSYALELAQRMGIPKEILAVARNQMGEEKTKLESLLAELEQQTQEYRQQLLAARKDREQLSVLVQSYESKLAESRKESAEIRKKAAEEAETLLKNAQATVERVVKQIREQSAERTSVQAARQKLRAVHDEVVQSQQSVEKEEGEQQFSVGDFVRLREGSETGEIVELRNDEVVVVWRNGTLRVPIHKLLKVRSPNMPMVSQAVVSDYSPQTATEIDVRGMLGDEALERVQRFLDDAVVTGLHRVDIIHGKGTGALRKKVTEFLKGYPQVKNFRLGEWNEGGSGVTVVELA
ncbi:MAG TPA: endonuclease MutS2 [Bacteroidota bacterium]